MFEWQPLEYLDSRDHWNWKENTNLCNVSASFSDSAARMEGDQICYVHFLSSWVHVQLPYTNLRLFGGSSSQ